MSYAYVNACKKLKVGNPVAKSILLLLADMADVSGYCYPGEEFIANTLEIGESTARKWISILAGEKSENDIKYITKGKLPGDKYKHNSYQLNFAPLFTDASAPEASPLPSDAENVSPLRGSGENQNSPLPESNVTATTYHRHEIAPNSNNKDLFKPPVEPLNAKDAGAQTARAREEFPLAEFYKSFPGVSLSDNDEELIIKTVKPDDKAAYLATIRRYEKRCDRLTGKYLPEKTNNFLSVFREERTKLAKKVDKNGSELKNGNNGKSEKLDAVRPETSQPSGKKPTNSDIIKSRNYDKYNGFDPIKTFG